MRLIANLVVMIKDTFLLNQRISKIEKSQDYLDGLWKENFDGHDLNEINNFHKLPNG